MLSLISFGAVALVLALAALIVFGAHRAALRSKESSARATILAAKVAAALAAWLGFVALLAELVVLVVLADFDARPPRICCCSGFPWSS